MVFARHEKVVERADDEAVHEAHHTAPQQRVGAELTVDRVVNRLIGVPVRGLERGLRELVEVGQDFAGLDRAGDAGQAGEVPHGACAVRHPLPAAALRVAPERLVDDQALAGLEAEVLDGLALGGDLRDVVEPRGGEAQRHERVVVEALHDAQRHRREQVGEHSQVRRGRGGRRGCCGRRGRGRRCRRHTERAAARDLDAQGERRLRPSTLARLRRRCVGRRRNAALRRREHPAAIMRKSGVGAGGAPPRRGVSAGRHRPERSAWSCRHKT